MLKNVVFTRPFSLLTGDLAEGQGMRLGEWLVINGSVPAARTSEELLQQHKKSLFAFQLQRQVGHYHCIGHWLSITTLAVEWPPWALAVVLSFTHPTVQTY